MKYFLVGAAIIAGTVMTAAAPLHERGLSGAPSGSYGGVSKICSEDKSGVYCCKPGKAGDKKKFYHPGGNNPIVCTSDYEKPIKAISKRAGRVASRTIVDNKDYSDKDNKDDDGKDDDGKDDDDKDDDDKDDDDKDDDDKDDDGKDDDGKDDDSDDDDKDDYHKDDSDSDDD
ncbi:MAG: hypothetical protein Q9207_004764 [Kuettlingeria erythrocarpa]